MECLLPGTRESVCVCVCVCVCAPYKASTAYHWHAVCVQEANVKLVWNFQVGALTMEPRSEGEKCLQSPVMPRHPSPSCSRRWSSAYNQQKASWHLLNNLSLSLPPRHLISPSSSSSSSSIPTYSSLKYPLISCWGMQLYRKSLILSCSQACAFFILLFPIWSEEQGGKPHSPQTL